MFGLVKKIFNNRRNANKKASVFQKKKTTNVNPKEIRERPPVEEKTPQDNNAKNVNIGTSSSQASATASFATAVANTASTTAEEKINNNASIKTDDNLKDKEDNRLLHRIMLRLKTLKDLTVRNLDVNKHNLKVQKGILSEMKEAAYDRLHKIKKGLHGAVTKVGSGIKNFPGNVKRGIANAKEKTKGFFDTLGKVLLAGYLLKKFWPLIKKKLIPYLTKTVWPELRDVVIPAVWDFMKKNASTLLEAAGIYALIAHPFKTLKFLTKTLLGASKIFLKMGGKAVLSVVKGLGKLSGKLLKGLGKQVLNSLTPLKDAAVKLKDKVFDKAKDLAVKAKDGVKNLAIKAKDKVIDIAGSVKNKAAKIGNNVKDKVIDFSAATKNKMSGIAGDVKAGSSKLFTTMSKNISEMKSNMKDKFKGMGKGISGIKTKVGKIKTSLMEKGIGAATKVGKGLGGALKLLKPLAKIVPFIGPILMLWDLLNTFFPDFTDKITKMFSVKKITELGTKIWDKVVAGVTGIGTWIAKKMKGFVGLIRDSLANIIQKKFGSKMLIGGLATKLANFIRGGKESDVKVDKPKSIKEENKKSEAKLKDSGIWDSNMIGKDDLDVKKAEKGIESGKITAKDLKLMQKKGDFSVKDEATLTNLITKAMALEKEKEEKKKDKKDPIYVLSKKITSLDTSIKGTKANIKALEKRKEKNKNNPTILKALNKTEDIYIKNLEKLETNIKEAKTKKASLRKRGDNKINIVPKKINTSDKKVKVSLDSKLSGTSVNLKGESITLTVAQAKEYKKLLRLKQDKPFDNSASKYIIKLLDERDEKKRGLSKHIHKKENINNSNPLRKYNKQAQAHDAIIEKYKKVIAETQKVQEDNSVTNNYNKVVNNTKNTDKKGDIANIINKHVELSNNQFGNGGFTGKGDSKELAGTVHYNEFVLSEEMVKKITDAKSKSEKAKAVKEASGGRGKEAQKAIFNFINESKPSGMTININGVKMRLTVAQANEYMKLADKQDKDPFNEDSEKYLDKLIKDRNKPKNNVIKYKTKNDKKPSIITTNKTYNSNTKEGNALQTIIEEKRREAFKKRIDDKKPSIITTNKTYNSNTKEGNALQTIIEEKRREAFKKRIDDKKPSIITTNKTYNYKEEKKSDNVILSKPEDEKGIVKKSGITTNVKPFKSSNTSVNNSSRVTNNNTNASYEVKEIKTSIPEPKATTEKKTTKDVKNLKHSDIFSGVPFKNMNPDVEHNMRGLGIEFKELFGTKMQLNSTGRSINEQKKLYDNMLKKNGGVSDGTVAAPGGSMHNYGLAVDAQSKDYNKAEKAGLLEKYNFHRPIYTKKGHETWHAEPISITNKDKAKIRALGKESLKKGEDVDKMVKKGKLTNGKNIRVDANGKLVSNDKEKKKSKKFNKIKTNNVSDIVKTDKNGKNNRVKPLDNIKTNIKGNSNVSDEEVNLSSVIKSIQGDISGAGKEGNDFLTKTFGKSIFNEDGSLRLESEVQENRGFEERLSDAKDSISNGISGIGDATKGILGNILPAGLGGNKVKEFLNGSNTKVTQTVGHKDKGFFSSIIDEGKSLFGFGDKDKSPDIVNKNISSDNNTQVNMLNKGDNQSIINNIKKQTSGDEWKKKEDKDGTTISHRGVDIYLNPKEEEKYNKLNKKSKDEGNSYLDGLIGIKPEEKAEPKVKDENKKEKISKNNSETFHKKPKAEVYNSKVKAELPEDNKNDEEVNLSSVIKSIQGDISGAGKEGNDFLIKTFGKSIFNEDGSLRLESEVQENRGFEERLSDAKDSISNGISGIGDATKGILGNILPAGLGGNKVKEFLNGSNTKVTLAVGHKDKGFFSSMLDEGKSLFGFGDDDKSPNIVNKNTKKTKNLEEKITEETHSNDFDKSKKVKPLDEKTIKQGDNKDDEEVNLSSVIKSIQGDISGAGKEGNDFLIKTFGKSIFNEDGSLRLESEVQENRGFEERLSDAKDSISNGISGIGDATKGILGNILPAGLGGNKVKEFLNGDSSEGGIPGGLKDMFSSHSKDEGNSSSMLDKGKSLLGFGENKSPGLAKPGISANQASGEDSGFFSSMLDKGKSLLGFGEDKSPAIVQSKEEAISSMENLPFSIPLEVPKGPKAVSGKKEAPEASIVSSSKTGNDLKRFSGNKGSGTTDTVKVHAKRDKPVDINNKTRELAKKKGAKKGGSSEKGNTTVINNQHPAPYQGSPQLHLSSTDFNNASLSLLGNIL